MPNYHEPLSRSTLSQLVFVIRPKYSYHWGHPRYDRSKLFNISCLKLQSGIGAACAIALAEAGASICLVLRDPASPNLATFKSIQALGVKVEAVYCDLGNLDATKNIFQTALGVMGGQIHTLVNCAGIQRRSPSVDFSENDWDDVSSVRPN